MSLSRLALFGACLALPATLAGSAMAQPADSARVIQVPPGAVVLILNAPQATSTSTPMVTTALPGTFPMMQLIAEQQAIMQNMFAEMNAMLPLMPDPSQLIQAAMHGGLPAQGVCGETMTYTFNGNGSKPVVHVSRYGDACGPAAPGMAQPATAPQQTAPVPDHQPRLLEIGYPPHLVPSASAPRT